MRNPYVGTAIPLVLAGTIACHGVDEPMDKAEVLSVLSAGGALRLEAGGQADLAVQAQNADGEGVDSARIFFLISEPAALEFVGRSDTDLVQELTKEQEAAGIKAHGIAKVSVRAGSVSTETTVRVVVGLASPSESTPESGVATLQIVVEPAETPDGEGGEGGTGP
ncbi:MAG TPA: hypothetical protein VIM73_08515 [Polyangiaceae bacterium]